MKAFNELGVKPKTLSGDKITIEEILDTKIIVIAYRIGESQYGTKKEEKRLLTLQIQHDGQKRIIFTSSEVLMDMLEKVSEYDFPFEATIIKESAKDKFWFKFT